MNEREELEALRRIAQLQAKAGGQPAAGNRGPNGELLDPTDPSQYPEAGFFSNMAAGGGKFLSDAAKGIGQWAGMVSREEIDRSKEIDKPLMARPEAVVGNVAMGALSSLPLAAVPGANTLPGAAITGGLIGAMEPVGTGDSRVKNMMTSGAFSTGAHALGATLPAAKAALYDPWFKRGQERVVGDVLRRSTSQPARAAANMANPERFVPGVRPSAMEAADDAGIATLQLGAMSADPKTKEMLVRQALENNAARIQALRSVAKDEAALVAAQGAREAASKPLYDAAKRQMLQADDELRALMSRPSMESAWKRAQELAKERGEKLVVGKDMPERVEFVAGRTEKGHHGRSVEVPGLLDASGKPLTKTSPATSAEYSGKGLHYLKMALDDMVDSAPQSGIGKNERAAVLETKKKLVEWFDRASPDYAAARSTYRAKSQPVNEMQFGQELEKRVTPALMDVAGIDAPTRLKAESFASALRDSDAAIRRATGKDLPIDEVLSSGAKDKVFGVAKDLARKARAEDMAKTVNSTTAQNLAAKNLMRQAGGPLGMPESWAESALLTTLFRPVSFIAKSGDAKIQQRMAEALMDPQYAAMLMNRAQVDPMTTRLALALRDYLPITAASAATQIPQ